MESHAQSPPPTDTFGFPIHINTEPNLSSKSNYTPIPCYSGVDVSCKVYLLRIIFVFVDVKNTFLMKISHYH